MRALRRVVLALVHAHKMGRQHLLATYFSKSPADHAGNLGAFFRRMASVGDNHLNAKKGHSLR